MWWYNIQIIDTFVYILHSYTRLFWFRLLCCALLWASVFAVVVAGPGMFVPRLGGL